MSGCEREERASLRAVTDCSLLSLLSHIHSHIALTSQWRTDTSEFEREKASLIQSVLLSSLSSLSHPLTYCSNISVENRQSEFERRERRPASYSQCCSLLSLLSHIHSHIALTSQWRTDERSLRERGQPHTVSAALFSLFSLTSTHILL